MLPGDFLERMQRVLGEEFGDFLESFEGERFQGLRLNPLKVGGDGRSALERFGAGGDVPDGEGNGFAHLSRVPWAEDGFYFSALDQPGKHPFHEAGVYYIQEPSAMVPAELLDVRPGERVLDLCAAPGGKSVQIGAKLWGRGLLVSNEIHPARAKILSENVERMGLRNVCVTNETPERLAEFFPGFFDRILVDAPCSGEGMFRKNEDACAEWSPENVRLCAERQDRILDCAAGMLRPGGRLVYSTCTFAPEEDEGSVCRFLHRHREFWILPVDKGMAGLEGCDGIPGCGGDGLSGSDGLSGCGGDGLSGSDGLSGCGGDGLSGSDGLSGCGGDGLSGSDGLSGCGGDGLSGSDGLSGCGGDGLSGSGELLGSVGLPGSGGLKGCDRLAGCGGLPDYADVPVVGLEHTVRLWPQRIKGEGHFAAVLQKEGEMPEGYRSSTIKGTAERISADMEKAYEAFCKENLRTGQEVLKAGEGDMRKQNLAAEMGGRYLAFGDNLYLAPLDMPSLKGLKVLRPGLHLGQLKKNRFEPAHALALALAPGDAVHVWNLDSGSPAALAYLNGQTFSAQGEKGWYLICVDGFSMGWGKLAGGIMKNHYPRGLRR